MSVNNGYNEFICNMILNGNEDDCRSNCKQKVCSPSSHIIPSEVFLCF